MGIVVSPPAEVTVLRVGWAVFETLVAQAGDQSHSHFAYDGELLEITSPSRKHEMYSRLLEALVHELCREWQIDLLASGSTKRCPGGRTDCGTRALPHDGDEDQSHAVA